MNLREWSDGNWLVVFTHQAAFMPVCSTEFVALARCAKQFRRRRAKLLGFSQDNVSNQLRWQADLQRTMGVKIDFPVVSDETGRLSRSMGLPQRPDTRKTIFVDPSFRVRMVSEVPLQLGRRTSDIVYTLDALQTIDRYGVAIPGDWRPGDDCLVPQALSSAAAMAQFGDRVRRLRNYLRWVEFRRARGHRDLSREGL